MTEDTDEPTEPTGLDPVEPAPEPIVESGPVVSDSAPDHARPSARPGVPPPPPGRGPTPDAPTPAAARPDAGEIVEGLVTIVDTDEAEMVLTDSRLAVVHRRNWASEAVEDLTTVASVGDRVEGAILAREDRRDRVVLSRAWALEKRAWERMAQLHTEGNTVTCKIVSHSKNGLVADVEGLRGFVPLSQVALEPKPNLSSFVGQDLELKIIEVDPSPRKRRLVLSRRSLLLREQRRGAQKLLSSLEPGQVRKGVVSSLSDYGAFVDLGGVNGLVHVSELSWRKVSHPSEVVSVGQELEVKVLEVKVKKRRVRLSLREVDADPLAKIEEGSIVTGPITRLVDFGAFVDLGGVEGLVHLSEMAEHRVHAPEELVTPGESVMVKVLSVDQRRRRIELSIRQAISDQFG